MVENNNMCYWDSPSVKKMIYSNSTSTALSLMLQFIGNCWCHSSPDGKVCFDGVATALTLNILQGKTWKRHTLILLSSLFCRNADLTSSAGGHKEMSSILADL
jgi:hypothetical protein